MLFYALESIVSMEKKEDVRKRIFTENVRNDLSISMGPLNAYVLDARI